MSLLEQMSQIGRGGVTPVTRTSPTKLPLEAPEILAVTSVTREKTILNPERLEVGNLTCREQDWLASIAGHLGCLPQHLLDACLIDRDDLDEQADANPVAVARLIRTDPRWQEVSP
ncbi:TPA: hypothetical protein NIC38_003107 [Pseudomonas aeruginosa]|uniref:hypothetical protein n=1 Tax=Pseudomonas aeruginosa TaxID=287 RepID=UPI000FC3FAF6|nr:hypothetical protein [Pseudomonas aeruginosa]MBU5955124.1 hypothetical protein [Pseudomonas aeruginosa]RUE05237.1 hypothetical protein IPC1228_05420 [Pseudomonas aeruginosa]HBP5741280.1 hypothetical protein [Pseudomonas aeruginosa]HCF2498890.1 hypothetical protein [Pseudomonas aeruginosa]HCF2903852.1 hypothetical protein [Pseudomonas aeruginosa]